MGRRTVTSTMGRLPTGTISFFRWDDEYLHDCGGGFGELSG